MCPAAPQASVDITSDDPVVVRGLCKQYAGRNVVDHVDLDVRAGEVFGFLGPNGAGKSTTIDILTGRRARTSGDISVLGASPADDDRAWRARIGVVPQTTATFVEMTVREVVTLFAAMYPRPLPVDEVIDMVGLTSKAKARTEDLSGGQQRRLDVAIGVIGDPELIFLDEPTTGLDPVARREAWDLVRYFGERGTTTVLTTHYLDEVEELAHRAAIIVAGKIVEVGTIAELSGRGRTPTTVSFIVPEALDAEPLPSGLDGLTREDRQVTVSTYEPSEVTYRLLSWAREHGVRELPGLRVLQPSLEDVYLNLVHQQDVAAPVDVA
ncbi:ABC transporter ATP-binding protein [Luteipulveratus mongoliensis]|uniref:ABC transporter domain-containing protein n=1 Tax=Luteipulveratus mongoliensis TaxID=571913 RepID=A0A0K1JQ20_9MICO|nr:ABC transporter ATP-binding protein [Luteipulveratus mongoliensis]AKU18693.1 hypothetical protein VV02_06495 [Luteipulveratus mongoliensis]